MVWFAKRNIDFSNGQAEVEPSGTAWAKLCDVLSSELALLGLVLTWTLP